MKKIKREIGLMTAFVALAALLPGQVLAATLQLSASTAAPALSSSFVVDIGVSSPDQAINAVSATLQFPSDKLEVVSVSKAASILAIWAQDPVFSNTDGTLSFSGVLLNPGYQGAFGRVLEVRFRAKAEGNAIVSMGASSVLANDGKGTEVLTSKGQAALQIQPSTANTNADTTPPSESTPPASAPAASGPTTLVLQEQPRADQTDPHAVFIISASSGSGIDHYDVTIDQGPVTHWIDDGSHVYTAPAVPAGDHTLNMIVTDKDGKTATDSAKFHVEATSAPTITSPSSTLLRGQPLVVRGTAAPVSQVTITSQRDGDALPQTDIVQSDAQGHYIAILQPNAEAGSYHIWANTTDGRGARSSDSPTVSLSVQAPSQVSSTLIAALIFMVFSLLLGVGLILFGIAQHLMIRHHHRQRQRKHAHAHSHTHRKK